MGSAYTPGLTVSSDTVVDRLRRLPIKGEVLVKVGDKVESGQKIAVMGRTGRVYGMTGIHLHFELIKSGKRTNPAACYAK